MDMKSFYLNTLNYGTAFANTFCSTNLLGSNKSIHQLQEQYSNSLDKIASTASRDTNNRESLVSPFTSDSNLFLPFQMDDQGNKIYQRNERERLRVRWINDGFQSVRNVLPSYLVKTRMSKLETLYLAIAHITHLEKVLEDENHVYSCTCYDNAFK